MLKKMEIRRLHNTELKKLVSILRDHPSSPDPTYHKVTKKAIKHLPSRLQSSALSRSSPLCNTHADLDHHLLTEMWSWVKHEFSAIGKFIYPLIVGCKLTAEQEAKMRQLESVLEMWRKDFVFDLSAAPDREPISHGGNWYYQPDGCAACMLARLGSDEVVLRALYAGMIGRFPLGKLSKLSSTKVVLAELGASAFDDPKSKRVRFVRYWIKARSGGDKLLFEAVELGRELKVLHREWKETNKPERVSLYQGRTDADDTTAGQDPLQDPAPIGLGIHQQSSSSPFHGPSRHSRASNPFQDPSPTQHPHQHQYLPQDHTPPSTLLTPVGPLRITKRSPAPPRPTSIVSTSTCQSYDGGPPAWKSHFPAPQLSMHHEVSAPSPNCMSMYYGHDDVSAAQEEECDPFDDADEDEDDGEGKEEVEPSTPKALAVYEPGMPGASASRVSRATTNVTKWSTLY